MSTSVDPVELLLRVLPESDHDRLVPLTKAYAVVERLTDTRPHVSAIYRWVGRENHPLRVVQVGSARFTTARWIVEHIVERGATNARQARPKRPRATKAVSAKARSQRTNETLRRHGLAEGGAR